MRLLGGLFTLGGPRATTAWRSYFEPVSLALLCSGFLFLLFAATFQALIRSPTAHIGLFALFAALLARLFIKGRQRYFSERGEYLLIEFVPKSDSQVQRLLLNRKDVFDDYNEESFRSAFSSQFAILEEKPIASSERSLFLMRRNR